MTRYPIIAVPSRYDVACRILDGLEEGYGIELSHRMPTGDILVSTYVLRRCDPDGKEKPIPFLEATRTVPFLPSGTDEPEGADFEHHDAFFTSLDETYFLEDPDETG